MSGTTAKFVRKVDRNNPLQYYLLENPNDRGARQTTVHGVARVRHDLVTKPTNSYQTPMDQTPMSCGALPTRLSTYPHICLHSHGVYMCVPLNCRVTLDFHLLTVTCGEEVMSRKIEVKFTINLKSMRTQKCVFNEKMLGDSYLISSFYGYVSNQTHYFLNQSRLCLAIR